MTTRKLSFFVLAIFLTALAAPSVLAQSVQVRLSDGTRWRGEVGEHVQLRVAERGSEVEYTGELVDARESLWIQLRTEIMGEMRTRTFFIGDIREIHKVEAPQVRQDTAPPRRDVRTPSGTRSQPGAQEGPGVFLLPLSGMVGLEFRHQEIEAIAAHADTYGPGQIIVLEIESGGGLVIEMEKIAATMREVKKRHRLVAWIREAISAGAATAAFCHEIYFAREGALGSMTMVQGGRSAPKEAQERWANLAGQWFQEGGRHPYIAHTMILSDRELSYDKDENGRVTWYNNLSGQHVLSTEGYNLTFNASNAVACGFADGIADTKEDLARLLDMPEWREISDHGRRMHAEWSRLVEQAQQEIQRAFFRYQNPRGSDAIARLGYQIQQLETVIRWMEQVPNVAFMMNLQPRDVYERQIAELRKQLSDLRRRR